MIKPRDVYYRVKPFLPRALRLEMRRIRARAIRQRYSHVWPISEGAGRTPDGWPGWPADKQFAFVLSHDVEGERGLARCRALAELEMREGFRSVFNFIPKGEYVVPGELLDWLVANGFEVGVHDYHHDGSLFRARVEFDRQSDGINRQLREWSAVGFRAGFMLHRLDWLHALDIEYDSSTFDVDPFEPQTDGVETIFPFWIPKPDPEADAYPGRRARVVPEANHWQDQDTMGRIGIARRGYVEMPYTLVQDYNLFLVLRERTTDIWDRKLAWIAQHGGMALLNTHPDYMAFGSAEPLSHEFPVSLYADFLRRVREAYGNEMLHDVPRAVARFVRNIESPQVRSPREVGMVVYNVYENDHRVRRYAESLVERGDNVSVFSIAGMGEEPGECELEGVRVFRLFRPDRPEQGRFDYLLNCGRFWWLVFRALQVRNFPNGCDLVHIHNMPEALVFAAFWLKWKGTRVILDLHDLMPELYQDKFHLPHNHIVPRLLRAIEARACHFSHHVIVSNHLWKETVARRSCRDGRLTALINHVNLRIFHRRTRTRDDLKFIILYPGSLGRHQGLDIAIDAMVQVRKAVPTAELHIYGGGPELVNLQEQSTRLGLTDAVLFPGGVSYTEMSDLMANADLGVVPKRADGFGNEAFSTKIMEFMSQGLPVVVSRTKIDSFYFNEDLVCFFESGNAADLAAKIIAMAGDTARRERLAANGASLVRANSWEAVRSIYLDVVDRLTRTRPPQFKAASTRLRGQS